MSNAAELPSLTRLRTLAPAEYELYWDLFVAAGGATDQPVYDGAVSLLKRSGLPSSVLQKIWGYADEHNIGNLDLEGFCVACRLCAHAQQAPDADAAEQVPGAFAAAETPQAPPWFESLEASHDVSSAQNVASTDIFSTSQMPDTSSNMQNRRGSFGGNSNFDFEAAAFGSGPTGGGHADHVPVGGSGLGAMPMLQVPGPTGHVQTGAAMNRRSPEADAAHSGYDTPSSLALAKGLGLRLHSQDKGHRHADVRKDPVKRLSEELLEGRQKLEQRFSDKRNIQRKIVKAQEHLEALRSEREHVVAELAIGQCDVQHMFTQLDFSRQQIEAAEKQLAHMHAMRQSYSHEDVLQMERTRSRFEQERFALGEDRHDTKASVQMSQDMARQDYKNIASLRDSVKRAERKKMELQSKQSLLLEDQRHAEKERGNMLYALEMERVKLHTMRSERLDIGVNAKKVLQEARKLARDTGVEPAVFAECFLPHTEEDLKEIVDPLALPPGGPSGGAWGPAAEHARGWEDASAWKKAVYRHSGGNGATDAPRFSVSGGNVDLTATQQWAQFGKKGPLSSDQSGRSHSHNHYRNAGLLGVPARDGAAGHGCR